MCYEQQAIGRRLKAVGTTSRTSEKRSFGRLPLPTVHSPQPQARRSGFSLVEIMIVIVIIGLLAGTVTLSARGYLIKAKQNTARKEIATIVNVLEAFYATYGRYPTSDEGLAILTRASEKLPEPLLKGEPIDPWDHPYQYKVPGPAGPYEVVCLGADGSEGGEGGDADISSDRLKETGAKTQP